MPAVGGGPVAACADRILALPAYGDLLWRLYTWRDSWRVWQLWEEVFGEKVAYGFSGACLDVEFIKRVDRQLFPVDTYLLDLIWQEHDEPWWNLPIPVQGLRVPWEVVGPGDLPEWQQVVAACIASNFEAPDWDMGGMGDDPEYYVPWLAGPADVAERELERLAALEGPLKGLADLARVCIQEPTGNPFLDWPDDAQWLGDYAFNDFYWTVEDIRYLAERYGEVREVAERIEAFRIWYFSLGKDEADEIVHRALVEAGRE